MIYQPKGGEGIIDGKLHGWTGEKCVFCKGSGEVKDARACVNCAGTGEKWGLMPTQPDNLSDVCVYIAHDDGRFDFTDAQRFGIVHVVVSQLTDSQDLYPDNIDERMPRIAGLARSLLANFRPEHDYLCLVGNPVLQALCAFILGQRHRQQIRVLRFDRKHQAYYAVLI